MAAGTSTLMGRKPWCFTYPSELETWYNENIQLGTNEFDTICRAAVDKVVRSVHTMCSTTKTGMFDVDRVIKGGSLGKGTMVKEMCDVDLIAFINPPNLEPISTLGLERYKTKVEQVVAELKRSLRHENDVRDVSDKGFLVTFTIKVGSGIDQRLLNVDFLPTADRNLGRHGAHSKMLQLMQQPKDRMLYVAFLVERQLQFVKEKPGSVKELIRLVKYWSKLFLPEDLQKSYQLELITIHMWEKAGKPSSFSKAKGLKQLLLVFTNAAREIGTVYWKQYYDDALAMQSIKQLAMKEPIVLDPATPTVNVCKCFEEPVKRQAIASAAHAALNTNLLKSVGHVSSNWQ